MGPSWMIIRPHERARLIKPVQILNGFSCYLDISCSVMVSAMFPGWFGTTQELRQQWTQLTHCWATETSVVWTPPVYSPSPPVFSLTCAVQCPLTSRSHCPLFSGCNRRRISEACQWSPHRKEEIRPNQCSQCLTWKMMDLFPPVQ